MIKYNHYLKDLGIKEDNYWLFEEKEDLRYLPDEEGFVPAEFFSLDTSFALYIYSHLCYFREHCLVAHPVGTTEEEWDNIINQMIEGFGLLIKSDDDFGWDKTESKRRQRKINKALRLFVKYFYGLWY